ncbi:MAG: DUF885 domain-containing protein [Acidobacteria bacterium]|nr:DUF885 domain-containing protein [Acidobacteriota bacterium]
MSIRAAAVVLCLIPLVLQACGRTSENAAVPAESGTNWATVRNGLIEEYLAAHPAFAVVAGRHEFDGRLPDWSAAGIAAEIRRLHAARDRATAVPDRTLTEAERFERDYLVARFDRDLFWLEVAEAPFVNPAWYLDWMVDNLDPAPYLTRNYAPLETRMRAYTAYARAVPQAAAQIRSNLRMPLARPLLERGVSAFRGLADFYQSDVPGIFAGVQDAALQQELRDANAAAAHAMRDLAGWLESQRATATGSFALGADRFARMLQMTEGVTTSLAELEAAGRADLARNQQALREACAKFAPGATIQACIARMNANKPRGGVVEGARAQLAIVKTFVQDAGVATIPGPEEANVDEAPPYNRANFAYVDIPGPYEKKLPATYYIAPPDPFWTPAEQRDYLPGQADLLFTSVHEVWPGHFLQFLHSNRNPSLVGRLFVGYAFAEGWAHYAEEMMWEMGLGQGDPEIHIGQLTNALMRNVRLLSAIGLHTKGMTVEESERMFREEAFTDVGTARQQATRGTYDPAYLNYTMGKLMIRKLRDDWTASRGGRQAWRQFHDEFLTYGGPPIPMVRQRMLGGAEGSLF